MSTLVPGDPLAHRALDGLLRAEAQVRRRLSSDLEREGLSATGFSVLVVLTTAGGELELRILRARLRTSKANATEVVTTLEARGLVTRRRLATDRRAASVSLTERGREIVDRLFPEHTQRVAAAFSVLDESEKRSLADIGRNLARRRPRRLATADELLGGRWAPGADELAHAHDRAARVRRAVAALPRGQRAAVALFYFAGLSHAETAALLRTRPGAVKARLHKARATLPRALYEEAPVMPDVQVRVADVRRTAGPPVRHVLLLEGEGVSLPIWIGEPDARALAATLDGVELRRPGSHQL